MDKGDFRDLSLPSIVRPHEVVAQDRRLRCLIKGHSATFRVDIAGNQDISVLREKIYEKCDPFIQSSSSAMDLKLSKVDISLISHTQETLAALVIGEFESSSMDDWEYISDIWKEQPHDRTLHVVVTLPPSPASHVPSAGMVSGTLLLTVVAIDGKSFQPPFHIEVDPTTKIAVVHNLIHERLKGLYIGTFHEGPLTILPLPETRTLVELQRKNLKNLHKTARRFDKFSNHSVDRWFIPGLKGIYFLVWLPSEEKRFPPNPWPILKYTMRCIGVTLEFQKIKTPSQSQADTEFKRLLKKSYGQHEWGMIHDMATGRNLVHSTVTGAHIFQRNWRKTLPQHSSFNEEDINGVQNGLLLYKPVESIFDEGRICIEVDNTGEMKFYLLDQSIRNRKLVDFAYELRQGNNHEDGYAEGEAAIDTTFGDLDGDRVKFPSGSTMRPAKRLLAVHAITAWAKHCEKSNARIRIPEFDTSDDEMTNDYIAAVECVARGKVREDDASSESSK